MSTTLQSTASQWFKAVEDLGEFMGIRFGRLPNGSGEVEWHHVSHVECDGIGGFTRLLRSHGATIDQLPKTSARCRGIIGPLWRLWRNSSKSPVCANRKDWSPNSVQQDAPPSDIAWHLFSEEQTRHIIDQCRSQKITVNSMLLKHLDASVRPEVGITQAHIPWMIPVNLRGDVQLADDTENHVSCVDVIIAPDDSYQSIHQQIHARLRSGEHRAKYLLLELGRFLSHDRKVSYLARDHSKLAGNIGAFSNLGSWDPNKTIASNDAWLFCPPVATGQRLSAGCLTFQNRLSLMLQAYPDPSTMQYFTPTWINRWVTGIISQST